MSDNATRDRPMATEFGPFTQGLVCAIALGALASTSGADPASSALIAFGVGLVAVFAGFSAMVHAAVGFFYTAVGVIALIRAVVDFVGGQGCGTAMPSALRYTAVVLLVVVVAVAVFASVTSRGWPPSAVGLGLYASGEILFSAGMFLSDAESSWLALTVMVALAPLLGWFVIRALDWVTALAAVPLSLYAIYGASLGGGCNEQNFSGAVLLVVFCVSYLVLRRVGRLFGGRT